MGGKRESEIEGWEDRKRVRGERVWGTELCRENERKRERVVGIKEELGRGRVSG